MKGRSFAVIGLGTFGSTVAVELARFGNPVLGMDTNERALARIADSLTEAIIGDGRDDAALREAGVDKYDVAVIAIGEDLEASILATMNAKMIGVETIWVKAMSRTHHRILSKLGVDRVVLPEQEIGQHVAQVLHNPLVRDYVSLGNGFTVVAFMVPETLDGMKVGDHKLFHANEVTALGVMRESKHLSCESGELILRGGDRLLLLGRSADLRRFADAVRAKG